MQRRLAVNPRVASSALRRPRVGETFARYQPRDSLSPTTTPDAIIYSSSTVPDVNGSTGTIVSTLMYFGNIGITTVTYEARGPGTAIPVPMQSVTNRGLGERPVRWFNPGMHVGLQAADVRDRQPRQQLWGYAQCQGEPYGAVDDASRKLPGATWGLHRERWMGVRKQRPLCASHDMSGRYGHQLRRTAALHLSAVIDYGQWPHPPYGQRLSRRDVHSAHYVLRRPLGVHQVERGILMKSRTVLWVTGYGSRSPTRATVAHTNRRTQIPPARRAQPISLRCSSS